MRSNFVILLLGSALFNLHFALPHAENGHMKDSHLPNSQTDEFTSPQSITNMNSNSESLLLPDPTKIVYAINSSDSEYTQLSAVGLTLEKGTSGTLKYNIRVNAIDARTLAKRDKPFVWKLTREERQIYWKLKSEYNNTLRIPWCWWLGINLNESSSKETMDFASEQQPNYNAKSWAAQKVFEYSQPKELELSGELKVVGWSFIPTTYYAFIKTARIVLLDGSTKIVVTSSSDDLIAATESGVMGFSYDRKHTISR